MKIGITVDVRHSMFSAGHPNSCIAIAEAFQVGGHEVVFLKRDSEKTWWDDVKALEADSPRCLSIDTVANASLDLVVEVAFFLTPKERSRFSKSIWYCRKQAIFQDLEATVFSCRTEGRDLEGMSEIWAADIFNSADDIVYLKNLYSVPVRIVPWLWSPTIVEAHRKQMQSPVWKQVKDLLPRDTKPKWSLHITETNSTNTSSCTIPLVTLKECIEKSKIEKIHIHNAEHLIDSKFFKENILDICNVDAKLVGRQRVIDWSHEPMSIILAHSRFSPLKLANLEAVWVGLPVIHNNSALKEFGCGLEHTYYENNNICDAASILEKTMNNVESVEYLTKLESLTELRTKILYRFSPEARAKEWLAVLSTKETVEPIVKSKEVSERKRYTILFTDMWDQFNPEYNMFILAFREELKDITVCGYSLETLPKGIKQDMHIFGPFGNRWRSVDGPKVHYTGENTGPISDKSIILNIGFKNINSPSYFRLPLWMLEINWFNICPSDLAKFKNPLPIPLESCTSASPCVNTRTKFCAFIVSNPKNTLRNEAFHTLSTYKPVDSAGKLFNTMGDALFAGLGGGGGALKKHEFLKD